MLWLGFIGWLMAFCGVYLIGEKRVSGFYVNVFANALLIVDAVLFAHWSLVFAMLAFTALNIINIWKWQFRKQRDSFESIFFAHNPQYTMQVLRDNQGISVDVSHDTHAESDSLVYRNYIDGADEQEMRREAIQNIINRDSAKSD